MKYTTLWNTNIKISSICLWTMTRWHQNTMEEAHEQMDHAIEKGVNFWDTAELYAIPPEPDTYGKTEEYIGERFTKTGKRKDVILASKVSWHGIPHIRNGETFTPDGIVSACENSLKRLQTDYIDLYQLHWPSRPVPIRCKLNYSDEMRIPGNKHEDQMLETLQTLGKLVKEGKVRHIWLSNETSRWIMKWNQLAKEHNLPRLQSVQNSYSLIQRRDDVDVAEVCLQENISYLPYSPLGWGVLSWKYSNGNFPEWARFSTRGKTRVAQYFNPQTVASAQAYADIAAKYSITPVQMALAWINQRAHVSSNIIWATKMSQLTECLSSIDITLSQECLADIEKEFSRLPNPVCW